LSRFPAQIIIPNRPAVSHKFWKSLVLIWTLAATLAAAQAIDSPQFSHPTGFYPSNFVLQITSEVAGAEIYYTLDGSTPTTASARYTGSLLIVDRANNANTISLIPTNNQAPGGPYREHWRPPSGTVYKGTPVRAIAVVPGAPQTASKPASATYFIRPGGQNPYSMPIFALVTDAEHLFSNETGIYVAGNNNNFTQRGVEWERPVHITMLETHGEVVLNLDGGVRIHGGTSRGRPLKTLRLYAKSEYGTSWMEYPVFPDKPVQRYKRLLLRNSGNDWSESMLRDAFMQTLLKGATSVDKMDSRHVMVFINGEFWGLHNLRDRLDERHIQTHHGADETEITMLETIFSGNDIFVSGTEDGIEHFRTLRGLMSTNTSTMSDARVAQISTMMDLDNFIDYQAANIFFRNTDWPGNNSSHWRYNASAEVPAAWSPADWSRYAGPEPSALDGRWRWMVFDTDFGFGLNFDYVNNSRSFGGNDASHNTLAFALQANGPGWPNPEYSTRFLRSLTLNPTFRARFVNRFADLLNSAFHPNHVTATLDSMSAVMRPHMPVHIQRWGEPASMEIWEQELTRMRTFGQQRATNVQQHLSSQFQLVSPRFLSVDVNDNRMGRVQVNSLLIDARLAGVNPEQVYPWSGIYFQGAPVTLTAHPAPGHRFSGWEGTFTSTEPTITVTLTGRADLRAVFTFDGSFPFDEMNPEPHVLSEGDYAFTSWDENSPLGTFPENMVFQQTSVSDPDLNATMTAPYNPSGDVDAGAEAFPYRLSSRTRINGLGERGISLINTGRGRDLGAVVLALDTRNLAAVEVSFTAGTEIPNSRAYALRLQGRTTFDGAWIDIPEASGQPVEYQRSATSGHEQRFNGIRLPQEFNDNPYVQLRWLYYYTGERLSQDSGARDMLRLDDIRVTGLTGSSTGGNGSGNSGGGQGQNGGNNGGNSGGGENSGGGSHPESDTDLPLQTRLMPAYPNPFNPVTQIPFDVGTSEGASSVRLSVHDLLGREVALLNDTQLSAGSYISAFDGRHLATGMYMVRLHTSSGVDVQKIMLVR